MNLVEVSDRSRCSVKELKNILLQHFDRIVLSEYSDLDEGVLISLLDYLDHQKNKGEESIKQGDDPLAQCLDELEGLVSEDIKYTRNLLSFCIRKKYLIFIDTCSLLNNHFYDFYKLFQDTTKGKLTLYVPYVVNEELKIILKKKGKEQAVLKNAKNRLSFIAEQCKKGNMKIVGDEEDLRTNERGEKVIHADRVIIEKLIYFRNDSRNSLLITQDYGVTVDALKQNDWQSTKSNAKILVKKIGRKGALVDNTEDVCNPKLPIDKTSERNVNR